jgi:CxxC motif-containing protein (DUF1111 family)
MTSRFRQPARHRRLTALTGVILVALPLAASFSAPAGPDEIAPAYLSDADRASFRRGAEELRRHWVVAPSALGEWGRGPRSNGASCVECHGAPGTAPESPGPVLRLAVPGSDATMAPHPVYGAQLQTDGIAGRLAPEGRVAVTWRTREVVLGDGTRVTLREPRATATDLAFGPLGTATRQSLRQPLRLAGLGLLEGIPERALAAQERESDRRGVPGHLHRYPDPDSGTALPGRFGWKATGSTLAGQVAAAFHEDIGVTSRLRPEENCPAAQADCLGAATGRTPELSDAALADLLLYLRHVPAPARGPADANGELEKGSLLFAAVGCEDCHRPHWKTRLPTDAPDKPARSIFPYTDLLVHDLGPELDDGFAEGRATGREWRTPPLWGRAANSLAGAPTALLHDGRARNVEEAILWHGGQGEPARRAYMQLERTDRERLVRFVDSL